MKTFVVTCCLFIVAACGSRERKGTAYILQRREADSGRLVLTYQFMAGEIWVRDSMEVANQLIPNDSLPVVFSSENPAESRLELPR